MSRVYAEDSEFRVVLLEADDWEILRGIKVAYAEDLQNPKGIEDVKSTPEEWWRNFLSFEKQKIFCLIDGYGEAIGFAEIDLQGSPECHFIFILSGYRGNKLSDLLHEAQFAYAAQETDEMEITLLMADNNMRAVRAALRNNYEPTDEFENGLRRYKRTLYDWKPKVRPSVPEAGPV